jgi:hypothetical protein
MEKAADAELKKSDKDESASDKVEKKASVI